MAKISLICEQCGGNIILDNSHEIGTCEHCFSQFVIKQDQIVQKITQNITKHVYGYEGKDVEELLTDGYKLIDLGDDRKANAKFKQAINIDPNCWSAWLGYASTGGDRTGYLSVVPAYRKAYNVASGEKQEMDTYVDMTRYLPDRNMRAAFIRAFNVASRKDRHNIFDLVSGVIGCDESEIASLAVDLCPAPAAEVLNIFIRAYRLAKNEGEDAKNTILSYIDNLSRDNSYSVFCNELKKQIQKEG